MIVKRDGSAKQNPSIVLAIMREADADLSCVNSALGLRYHSAFDISHSKISYPCVVYKFQRRMTPMPTIRATAFRSRYSCVGHGTSEGLMKHPNSLRLILSTRVEMSLPSTDNDL